MTDDGVNHPKHYGGANAIYEGHKVLEAWMSFDQMIGYIRGQAIIYLMRAGSKAGEPVEKDLAKAAFYVNYEIDYRRRYAKGDVGENRTFAIWTTVKARGDGRLLAGCPVCFPNEGRLGPFCGPHWMDKQRAEQAKTNEDEENQE